MKNAANLSANKHIYWRFGKHLLTLILTMAVFGIVLGQSYPKTWQVNGNGYTGLLILQSVDQVSGKVSGTLLGTPVEGYLVGRHIVLHRYPQGSTQIWEAWIMDPKLGAAGQAYYDGSYFMAGYVSENGGSVDGVYPWYGLALSQAGPNTNPNTNSNTNPNTNTNTNTVSGPNANPNQTPNTGPNGNPATSSSARIDFATNGHSYQLFKKSMTWQEAKVFCQNQGGYLATLTSQAENDFVYDHLIAPNGHYAWLGGTDEGSEGNWHWVTAEPWSYNNWPQGQPDNYQGNENYLHSYYGNSNSWNDLANDHSVAGYEEMYFVCEWGQVTSTQPTPNIPKPVGAITSPQNGHHYKIFQNPMSWHEAEVFCQNQGGYLATLTSQSENDFVYNNLIASASSYVWLGGTDEGSEGNWRWVTGEAWQFTNWKSGEPNNLYDGEHFLHAYNDNNLWNDLDEQGSYYGREMFPLCEWGQVTSTQPTPNIPKPVGATTWPQNGHHYKIFQNPMSWHEAEAYCDNQGGYLATLTSQAENDFVYNQVVGPIDAYIWLGGTDEAIEGKWHWITGEAWNFANWGASEPNNAGGAEHYAHTNDHFLNQWNDAADVSSYSNIRFYPLCEWGGFVSTASPSGAWTVVGGNLVKNGDFEDPPITQDFIPLNAGVAFLNYWEIESPDPNQGIDLTRMKGFSYENYQAIDMAGTPGPGTIYQELYLEAGKTYRLSFMVSSNGAAKAAGVSIYWGTDLVDTISTPEQGKWQSFSYDLYAPSDKVRLKFVGNLSGDQGSLLDNVRLFELHPTTGNPPGFEQGIIGTWEWFTGDKVRINRDGTISTFNNQHAIWEKVWDGNNYVYTIIWNDGEYTDTLTMVGNRLDGHNQNGTRVWGERITQASQISSWTDLGGNAIDVAIQGTTVWMISKDNQIFYYDDGWRAQPGNMAAKAIDVSRDGVLWIIGVDNRIYNNKDGVWKELPGNGLARDIALDAAGKPSVAGRSSELGPIAYYDGNSWLEYSGDGLGYRLAVSSDGIPYCIGGDLQIWRHDETGWVAMGLENLVDIAMGGDNVLWAVDKDTNIYYYQIGEWKLHNPGKAKRISAGANGELAVVGLDDHIWIATYD